MTEIQLNQAHEELIQTKTALEGAIAKLKRKHDERIAKERDALQAEQKERLLAEQANRVLESEKIELLKQIHQLNLVQVEFKDLKFSHANIEKALAAEQRENNYLKEAQTEAKRQIESLQNHLKKQNAERKASQQHVAEAAQSQEELPEV